MRGDLHTGTYVQTSVTRGVICIPPGTCGDAGSCIPHFESIIHKLNPKFLVGAFLFLRLARKTTCNSPQFNFCFFLHGCGYRRAHTARGSGRHAVGDLVRLVHTVGDSGRHAVGDLVRLSHTVGGSGRHAVGDLVRLSHTVGDSERRPSLTDERACSPLFSTPCSV